jgi:hypothetical protein
MRGHARRRCAGAWRALDPDQCLDVDLRASLGGYLTAPPDSSRAIGWVVRTEAPQGQSPISFVETQFDRRRCVPNVKVIAGHMRSSEGPNR